MIAAAWPAPPAPDAFDWSRCYIRALEAMIRRAPSPKLAPAPAAVYGVAARFGAWHYPHVDGELYGARVLYLPGCLGRSLRDIEAGRETFQLRLDHDRALVRSDDGCMGLTLDDERGRLLFALAGTTPAGRRAVRAVRETGWRQLSIGLALHKYLRRDREDGVDVQVRTARIIEVSIVPAGALRNCWLHT
jgi:hypothetical protein